MSGTPEMSKTTGERIESVFDEFVVKKIISELDPIKNDIKRSHNSYQDRTTRECIENICRSVGELENSLSKIKKSISLQEPDWIMSEQIQRIVDTQDDMTDEIDERDSYWQKRHDSLVMHIDAECASIKSELSDKIQTLFVDESTARREQGERVLDHIADLSSMTSQSNASLRTVIDETHKKSVDTLLKAIDERNLQIEKNETANTSTLQTSIETHASDTVESIKKIGSDIQKAQVENNERVKDSIGDLTGFAQEVSQRQESQHSAIVKQIDEFETSNARKLDEFLSLYKNENQRLKKMLYISWAIGGTTLVATIASILIRLL